MGRRNKRNGEDEDNGFAAWGGYMEAKKAKLAEQFASVGDVTKHSDLFKGVAILINGYTKPNSDELKRLMAENGGVFHLYQNQAGLTTHIIATNLPNVKINQMGNVPIVRPEWITDSVSQNRLVDYCKYLLYTNQSRTQPKLNFSTTKRDDKPPVNSSDPGFLSEFYNNSRLHLISTLGAEFKQLVNDLRAKNDGRFPARETLVSKQKLDADDNLRSTVVMHIDMDCFFASVGLRDRPELKGKPVVVTHGRGNQTNKNTVDRQAEIDLYLKRLPKGAVPRLEHIDNQSSLSEIASCSYDARKYGVKNGMFLGAALKLCPDLVPIPYDFQGYREVSSVLYETIASYTLDIEAVSCDEMYVDITGILNEFGMTVYEWASHIRGVITSKTGCPCSTGFGSNRLQARLATKKAKPDGQYYLEACDVENYVYDLPLSELPGVGRATLAKLSNLGLTTCGDVQTASLATLKNELGAKNGETIYRQAKGIDDRRLCYEHERKSVSAEVNYGIRFKTNAEVLNFIESLSKEVHTRLLETRMRAKCVTLKLMIRANDAPKETAKYLGHGVCDSVSKSTTTNYPINDPKIIYKETNNLYNQLNVKAEDLRGIGIQLSRLEKGPDVSKTLARFLTSTDSTSKRNLEKKSNQTEQISHGFKANAKKGVDDYFKETKDKPIATKSMVVDVNVLNELPLEIRNEIIKEYKLEGYVEEPKAKTIENESMVKAKGFSDLSDDGVRILLRNWMRNESRPKDFDVDMLGDYFKSLALQRSIEKLFPMMNFLHRNLSKMNCDWHDAYLKIVNYVQQGMIARYGNSLSVNTRFECTRHC